MLLHLPFACRLINAVLVHTDKAAQLATATVLIFLSLTSHTISLADPRLQPTAIDQSKAL